MFSNDSYDIIGKMETFTEDSFFIKNKLDLDIDVHLVRYIFKIKIEGVLYTWAVRNLFYRTFQSIPGSDALCYRF